MGNPRAILFDMDDTLLDHLGGVSVAWELVCREVAPELGCDWEGLREAIRAHASEFWKDEAAVGHWRTRLTEAREHVVRTALQARGLDPAPATRIATRYEDELASRIVLFEDTLETLEALRAAGLRLGMITNGPAMMQRDKVARFGFEQYMDVIVIEGEFGHGKPAPQVFEHALASVEAAPHEAWMVGDNLYADIGGAKAAGIHAVWIHRGRLELLESAPAQPDRVIGHLSELREALRV
jgi:putative hydrolase of the HAD superfamily